MRWVVSILLVLLIGTWSLAQSRFPEIHLRSVKKDSFSTRKFEDNRLTVIILMSPDCPITRQYIPLLARLYQQYESHGVGLYGVFPPSVYQEQELQDFQNTYQVPFALLMDTKKGKCTHWLKATVTPEVFVLDSTGKIQYQGAIDNQFYALGKRRAEVTENYLIDALNAVLANDEVKIPVTKSFGCLIEVNHR